MGQQPRGERGAAGGDGAGDVDGLAANVLACEAGGRAALAVGGDGGEVDGSLGQREDRVGEGAA
jgi:hypothetical protein